VKLLSSIPKGRTLSIDVELYPNYFLFGFMDMETDEFGYLEISPDSQLDPLYIGAILGNNKTVGFNSIKYDIPILWLAYSEPFCDILKRASDRLIFDDYRIDQLRQEFGFTMPNVDHIDLIEVCPLKGSLKTYAARLHTPHLQDLPFHPNKTLNREEALVVRNYNFKDLANNKLIWSELREPIKLREQLSSVYNTDLRSRSDAQIAESVIAKELQNISRKRPKPPRLEEGYSFNYKAPSFISFQTEQMKKVLNTIETAKVHLGKNGRPQIPKEIEKLQIKLDGKIYRMGIGGLHSEDENQSARSDNQYILKDIDVASYYPNIILNCGLFPKHLGEAFLTVYRTLVERRLKAKAENRKTEADGLKITINGCFGKLGSPYSIFYSPDLLIQVTVTGQLALLMLIERLILAHISVVSANTDGILVRVARDAETRLQAIVSDWERLTGFATEDTPYAAFYARDVNNYLGLKPDGKFKEKGVYSEVGSALNSPLSKNPEHLICLDAMSELILNGVPVEKTITECRDMRRFVLVRAVKGGAIWKGNYLGKVIRWYYAKGEYDEISYAANGNKVPKSEGSKPLMDLPTEFPADIDYERYIKITNEMLEDIRFYEPVMQRKLF